MRYQISIIIVLFLMLLSIVASAQQIRGDYLETRSADVYTGQCFANGEVNLVGNEAILAWRVQSGSWDGVPLEGLTVAAAVRAKGTLGDPYENPYPAKSVLLVDDQASAQQRTAYYPPLTQLSHSMPAVALTDSYSGPGLGTSWDLHGKRSAFVGTFAR